MDKEHIFFENYARNWDRDRKADAKILSSFMELAGIRPGSVILDAGCGTGVLLPYLSAAAGDDGTVEGFDYSQQMIDVAKEKFSHLANVTFTTGDVLKYHFPEKHYDVVCCLNFYPHIASHSRDVIRRLFLDDITPEEIDMLTGLFTGLGTSLAALMTAELTGVDKGLAWYINWVKGWADYPRMYVGLIILVTFCRTLMVLLFKIRSSLLAWQQNLVRW